MRTLIVTAPASRSRALGLSTLVLLSLSATLGPSCSRTDRSFAAALGDGDGDGDGSGGNSSNGGTAGMAGGSGTGGVVTCEELTQETACAGKCGAISVCESDFDCEGCIGEATCGAIDDNVCGCEDDPCAITSVAYGDTLNETIEGIAIDSTGAVYVLGTFRGEITFGPDTYSTSGSYNDTFLVKYDRDGEVEWSRGWGDTGDQDGVEVVVDAADNVIVAINNSGTIDFGGGNLATADIVAVKLNSDGEFQWKIDDGTQYSAAPTGLAVDPANNDVYLGGHFWGTLEVEPLSTTIVATGDQSYYDAFVLRVNAAGTPISLKGYGDGLENRVYGLAPAAGYVYVAALFQEKMNFGTSGTTELSTDKYYGLALAKLNQFNLSHTWSRGFDTEVGGVKLASDEQGNLYLVGEFTGDLALTDPPLSTAEYETFLVKLDSDGEPVWGKQFANVALTDVAVSPNGELYVAGGTSGVVDLGEGALEDTGSQDMLIARFDPESGDLVWLRHYPITVGAQTASAIAASDDESTWVGSIFGGQVDFGVGAHSNQGGTDISVIHFAP